MSEVERRDPRFREKNLIYIFFVSLKSFLSFLSVLKTETQKGTIWIPLSPSGVVNLAGGFILFRNMIISDNIREILFRNATISGNISELFQNYSEIVIFRNYIHKYIPK